MRSGGIDIATGLAFKACCAHRRVDDLTPLTTLIAALVDAGGPGATVATATAQLATALDLPPGIDYTTFDPIAASLSGETDGDAAYAAGVQVYNTIVQAGSLNAGAGGGTTERPPR